MLTSSANAVVPKSGSEPYDVSKTAVNHLIRELAIGLGPAIRVNGIAPATVVAGSSMFPRDRVIGSLRKYSIAFDEDETTEDLRAKLADFYAGRTITRRPITPARLRARDLLARRRRECPHHRPCDSGRRRIAGGVLAMRTASGTTGATGPTNHLALAIFRTDRIRRGLNDHRALIFSALDRFRIELPSWGFADTGTRFGVFHQPAAARTLDEKLADAGFVHSVTGVCPTVALHVQWDLPGGRGRRRPRADRSRARPGIAPGAINPNFFQDQAYKHGSFGTSTRRCGARRSTTASRASQSPRALGSRDVSCWFADGSNYPGTANIRERKRWFEEGLREMHAHLAPGGRLLVEYKPFEPAFYHTDIADWGMALLLARAAGPSARVLVDTGHHYASQNIEQIVAWLLAENMLGGFHFNDRRYADDDLTIGSIDPYQVFRIFHEIGFLSGRRERPPTSRSSSTRATT